MKLRIVILAALALLVVAPAVNAHEGDVDTQDTMMLQVEEPTSIERVALDEEARPVSAKLELAEVLANDILDSVRPMTHCNGAPHCSSQAECESICVGAGRCMLFTGCCFCQ